MIACAASFALGALVATFVVALCAGGRVNELEEENFRLRHEAPARKEF